MRTSYDAFNMVGRQKFNTIKLVVFFEGREVDSAYIRTDSVKDAISKTITRNKYPWVYNINTKISRINKQRFIAEINNMTNKFVVHSIDSAKANNSTKGHEYWLVG